MNSNTTDRRHPTRRRRSSGGGRSRGGPQHHPQPTSAHSRAPALEPTPCETLPVPFASLNLDSRLAEGIRDLGYTETRSIQSAVIPLALAGRDLIDMQGTVVAVHSGGLYRVQCDAGHEVLAQLSGRMRRFRIKVVPGDRVTVGVSPYDPVRGIITFRAR